MSKKHKKVCRPLNYFEHSLVFVSAVTRCDSLSAVASIVGIPARNKSLCNNRRNFKK